jgi:hypothetical protein
MIWLGSFAVFSPTQIIEPDRQHDLLIFRYLNQRHGDGPHHLAHEAISTGSRCSLLR